MQTTPQRANTPRILITRPAPGAAEFAEALQSAHGGTLDVILSPVLRIVPTGDVPALVDVAALAFTSRNGVRAFAERSAVRGIPCFTVGDATARAAQEAGFETRSARGDMDDLVALLAAEPPGGPVLHLRGAHVTGDLVAKLATHGIAAQQAVIYDQRAEGLSDAAQAALTGTTPVILPLFSARSARLVFDHVRPTCPLIPVAISDAVADALPEALTRMVLIAEAPDAEAMLAATGQALEIAKRVESAKGAQ